MRNKILILPLIFLVFCGCTSKNEVTLIVENITFNAAVTYGEAEFECYVENSADGLNATVVKPEEIKDFLLKFSKEGVTAEYLGISYSPKTNNMPQTAVMQMIYDVVNHISSQGLTAKCENDNCTLYGNVGVYDYSFNFSPSGLPISLAVSDLDFEVKFNNVTIKQ